MAVSKVIRVTTLNQVLGLLAETAPNGMLIAGGTDLINQLRSGRTSPECLIDISGVKELQYIKEDNDYLEIGAGTTFTSLASDNLIAQWAAGLQIAARGVGSPQIRNRGTVGGNICNGSPAADTVPPLLALDAMLTFQNTARSRQIPLSQVHQAQGQAAVQPDEILTSIRFKKVTEGQGLGFYKLGLRKALAISTMSISVFLDLEGDGRCRTIRVASGSLARFPQRETSVEERLYGQILNEDTMYEAAQYFSGILKERLAQRPQVEQEYKPEAVKGVLKAALELAREDINKGGRK